MFRDHFSSLTGFCLSEINQSRLPPHIIKLASAHSHPQTTCQIALRNLAQIMFLFLQQNRHLKAKSALLKRLSTRMGPTLESLAPPLLKNHSCLLKRRPRLLTRQTAQQQGLESFIHLLNRQIGQYSPSLPPHLRQMQLLWQGDGQERRRRIFKCHNRNLIPPCTQTKEWGKV